MKTREQNEVARNSSGISPPRWRKVWLMFTQLIASLVRPTYRKRLASSMPSTRARICDALRGSGVRGATFEEVARDSGLNANTVGGRLSDLAQEGVAIASDRRRAVSSGRKAVVYLASTIGGRA